MTDFVNPALESYTSYSSFSPALQPTDGEKPISALRLNDATSSCNTIVAQQSTWSSSRLLTPPPQKVVAQM